MDENWRVIPTEIIKEMAEALGVSGGEIIYMIGYNELPEDMAELLEDLLKIDKIEP